MPTAPTPITPLPTAPSRADPANFPARADAFMSALPTFGSQLNANASAAFTNASDSVTAANNAAASQTSAAASATAAAASAVTAVNAPGTSGTSTTSLTIGTGSQTFTTQTGKAWVVGQFVTVASTASPTNFMHGQITAYNSGTGSMTVNVLAVGGSGTLASWTIGLVGPNATLTDQNSLQPVALTLPNIRPSLLLDFANSKKLDPRITFTRATSGTYYDGVTSAKAEENLLLRSQDFSATWTLANLSAGSAVTAPDATATGSSFTASAANGTLTQSVTALAGDHTFSVWLRRVSGTGNIDITAHSGGTWVTQTITSSWARYTVTQTLTAGSRTPGIRIVTSGDQIEVWGAQLEQRSAATAYTPTTTQPITNYIPQLLTAPAGVPRFDHNPTTGESLGLLVEEQRTNSFQRSQDFGNAYWTKGTASISSDTVIAPDGTLTADKLVVNSGAVGGSVSLSQSYGIGTTHTVSVYAKSDGVAQWAVLIITGNTGTQPGYLWFNLVTGAIGTNNGGFTNPVIFSAGNGWFRLSASFTSGTGTNTFYVAPASADNVATYAGNGYSGIFIWGAQVEAGTFPTSYIPTTSASVTRTADDARMTGVNFSSWYRQDEGTFTVQASINNTVDSPYVWLDDASAAFAQVVRTGANVRMYIPSGGGGNFTNIAASQGNGVYAYVSFGYAAYSWALSVNASAVSTLLNGGLSQMTRLGIGQRLYYGTQNNGHIRRLAYYPKRLTNAQLQALTA